MQVRESGGVGFERIKRCRDDSQNLRPRDDSRATLHGLNILS